MTARKRGPHRHDWFPDLDQSEFLGHADYCLDCRAHRFTPPWGDCLGGHPLAEHYGPNGESIKAPACKVGQPL